MVVRRDEGFEMKVKLIGREHNELSISGWMNKGGEGGQERAMRHILGI